MTDYMMDKDSGRRFEEFERDRRRRQAECQHPQWVYSSWPNCGEVCPVCWAPRTADPTSEGQK
jgi:hypothetical protein